MPLVDVVNFNADASCLASSKWLRCLEGGRESLLVRVLTSFVRTRRKVNLGIVGATVCDIARFNAEAIELVNEHPEVFELVLRPFAHDNALLRMPHGFRYNVERGIDTLRRTFGNVGNFYLAPEIMTTGEQIHILREIGVAGIFLHKGRYDVSVARHVPDEPFEIHGVLGASLPCVPFAAKDLQSLYLRALHGTATPEQWAEALSARANERQVAIWRDGESSLLHPLEPEHEARMLEAETVERIFLSEMETHAPAELPNGTIRYFPLHSLEPWLKTMKLYWFVERVQQLERQLDALPDEVKRFWLLTINSDILSSAEKAPPVVEVSEEVLRAERGDFLWEGVIAMPQSIDGPRQMILTRSERAGEGEDYLAYLERLASGKMSAEEICASWNASRDAHLRKAAARVC